MERRKEKLCSLFAMLMCQVGLGDLQIMDGKKRGLTLVLGVGRLGRHQGEVTQ